MLFAAAAVATNSLVGFVKANKDNLYKKALYLI
jgi:hypothetical protein